MSQQPQTKDLPIDGLRADLEGTVITPDDQPYDDARQVFFKGYDRRPLAIAKVAGAEDVSRVVSLARDAGLELAVRSGGHSRAGYGTTDGGLVIDLSGMKGLEIDADAKTASVEAGITAGEYTVATGEHGLVTGLGDTGSVGIGGITLAGGVGFLVRKNGRDDRRPARRRGGDRRRRGDPGERGQRARPLLGDPRRRGQLRRRHALPVPPARDLRDRRGDAHPAGDARDDHRLPRRGQGGTRGALDHRQRDARAADAVHPRGRARQADPDGADGLRRPGRSG